MAHFNQLLASDFADFLRRRFGEDISLDAIAPELLPVLALQSDRLDWAHSLGEVLVSDVLVVPAVAGQTSTARLLNPAGSGVIATVKEVEVGLPVLSEVALGVQLNQANLATLGAGPFARDARSGSAPTIAQGVCRTSRTNNVAVAGTIRQITLLAQTSWSWNPGIVLIPGMSITVATLALNAQLDCSFHWVERRARPEELQ